MPKWILKEEPISDTETDELVEEAEAIQKASEKASKEDFTAMSEKIASIGIAAFDVYDKEHIDHTERYWVFGEYGENEPPAASMAIHSDGMKSYVVTEESTKGKARYVYWGLSENRFLEAIKQLARKQS